MVSRRAFISSVAGAAVAGGLGTYLIGSNLAPQRVDPVFGFLGKVGNTPPKRPDHEVFLLTDPRPPEQAKEFFFQPTGVFCNPGDSIMFIAATPGHTVTVYHPAFGRTMRAPAGASFFSSPVLPEGVYWLYTFEQKGVYDIYCAAYEVFGMAMRVVAGFAAEQEPPPAGPPPTTSGLRPPEFSAALVLQDPALNPRNIISRDTVPWAELNPETKKRLLTPTGGL